MPLYRTTRSPGMDGIELPEIVRSKFGDLPFVLFTGKDTRKWPSEAIDNGGLLCPEGEDARPEFAKLGTETAVQRKSASLSRTNAGYQISDLINLLPDASFAIYKQETIIA